MDLRLSTVQWPFPSDFSNAFPKTLATLRSIFDKRHLSLPPYDPYVVVGRGRIRSSSRSNPRFNRLTCAQPGLSVYGVQCFTSLVNITCGKLSGHPSKDAEGLPVEVFAERRVYKISTLYDSVQEFALLRRVIKGENSELRQPETLPDGAVECSERLISCWQGLAECSLIERKLCQSKIASS